MDEGHLFVVPGRLENLDCDAVVIPTSLVFGVRRIWASALGVREEQASKDAWRARAAKAQPIAWPDNGWGRGRTDALPFALPTWFIDSTDRGGLDGLSERLTRLLADVARNGLAPSNLRPRPLVALPVLGVGHGGFGAELRGRAIRNQLEVCLDAVRRYPMDVVIVAFNPSDYSAIQSYRLAERLYVELPPHQSKSLDALVDKVSRGALAVFFGAGVSMSAGLPSWNGLLTELDASADPAGLGFSGLDSALDQAQLLRKRLGAAMGQRVAEIVSGRERYGLSHALLAALDCPHAVTTNYDELYESAYADGHQRGGDLHVLPYGSPEPSSPWLVKMHGDVKHPDDIVLARSDFVGYSARSGPLGAVVQSLLMTEHLLVVGASLSDDNFLRLAHEVLAFRAHNLGTVLKFSATRAERELWGDEFDFIDVSSPGAGAGESARRLAIFLDVLAMRTAKPHHILDEKYQELLSEPEKKIARGLRSSTELLESLPHSARSRWRGVRDVLQAHGA